MEKGFSPSLSSRGVSEAVMNPSRQDAQHSVGNGSCLTPFPKSYSHEEADPQKPKNPAVGRDVSEH